MSGLCWVLVMFAFSLSAENSLAAKDANRLATIVNAIVNEYGTNGMFSLAVSIPNIQNQNINQLLQQVFTSDPADDVNNTINNNDVYSGRRVVAAKVLSQNKGSIHAESRVADHLVQLFNKQDPSECNMLLFYVYASPCVEKCSNKKHHKNILQRINTIRNWSSYAVVFSKIFKPRNGLTYTDQQRITALWELGTYEGPRGPIGLDNIFRCDKANGGMMCISCSSGTQVTHDCISGDTIRSTSSIQPQQGNRNSNRGRGSSGGGRNKRSIIHETGGDVSSSQYGLNANVEDMSSSQIGVDNDNVNDDSTTDESVSLSRSGHDDSNGNDVNTGEDMSSSQIGVDNDNVNDDSNTGESVSLSRSGPDDSNGNYLNTAENASSSQRGLDFDFGNSDSKTVKGEKGKGEKGRGKGKGVKGRGKGKGVKGRGKGKGLKGRGKGLKGRGKGKGLKGRGKGVKGRGKGKGVKGRGKGLKGRGKGLKGRGKGKGVKGRGKGLKGRGKGLKGRGKGKGVKGRGKGKGLKGRGKGKGLKGRGKGKGVKGRRGKGKGVKGRRGKGKRVKGRRGKGKGVKGRRGKGKGVKGRRGKGKGVKGRRGKGKGVKGRRGKGKGGGSRRGVK